MARPPNTRMQRTRSSPSARHSPLMRWPLGLPKAHRGFVVVLAAASMFGCRSTSEPKAEATWQSRCHVQPGAVVTGAQAECIAALAGLAKGVRPWTIVPVANRYGETWTEWRISSVERRLPGPGVCEMGSEIVINRQTGAVVRLVHDVALAICD